ncbi:MAG TPA: sensor histidine kinase [Solirubrobacteraceae bacterium]|nr:sensor histidine kinase [Solirubrobacteraceae bacterium]
MSLRRALVLVALEGLAVGLVALALGLASDHTPLSPGEAAIFLFVGWSFVGTGLFAWWRRPDSRFGVLMAAVGFTWFLGALVSAGDPWLFTLGVLLANVHAAVFAHMLLAYPDGRLGSRGVRRLVAAAYALCVVGPTPYLLFGTNAALDCDGCPRSPLFVADDETAFQVFGKLTSALGVILVCLIVYVLLRRWRDASPPRRRDMGPVLLSGIALLGLLAASLSSSAFGGPAVLQVGTEGLSLVFFAATPYGFLFGLLRSRVSRAGAVSEMLRRMGEGGRAESLRDQLADALGDRTLALAYWLEDPDRWVDGDGHAIALPGDDDPRRGVTEVRREGRRVGAIVHDRALCEDSELLASVAGAAGLALENARLQAQLRARVEELHASRARIVEAATAERRRLERNLHDGAQQRLVALSLTLRLAQGRVRKDAAAAEKLLTAAQDDLKVALEELRELARGIHPAVLSDRGLGAALEALAGRSPVPVELEPVPPERLPAPVEAAAYFVVAEALTNVAKYADASRARVAVSRADGHAVVEIADDGVGGADPGRGSGLRGLADRVSALDGRLDVESPPGAGTVLRAEIPV